MFSNVGWSETIILVVAALIIIGPERLPGALRWTIDSMRQLRDFAAWRDNTLEAGNRPGVRRTPQTPRRAQQDARHVASITAHPTSLRWRRFDAA